MGDVDRIQRIAPTIQPPSSTQHVTRRDAEGRQHRRPDEDLVELQSTELEEPEEEVAEPLQEIEDADTSIDIVA